MKKREASKLSTKFSVHGLGMTKSTNNPRFTRTCKLGKIKECSVIFHTNIKSKLFCCDDHRYRWHNNLKSLFRRMVKLEDSFESVKKAFSKLAKALGDSLCDPLKKIAEFLEERKND